MTPQKDPANNHHHSVWLVILVIGSLSLVLGAVGEFSGLFSGPSYFLEAALAKLVGIEHGLSAAPPLFSFAYLALIAYGTPSVMLSVNGVWRGALFWMVSFVLSGSLIMILALYQIWLNPLAIMVASIWSAIGSLYHLSHVKDGSKDLGSEKQVTEQAIDERDPSALAVDSEDEWKEFRR